MISHGAKFFFEVIFFQGKRERMDSNKDYEPGTKNIRYEKRNEK